MAGSILHDCNETAQPYAELAMGCSGLAALATWRLLSSMIRKHASTIFLRFVELVPRRATVRPVLTKLGRFEQCNLQNDDRSD